MHIHANNVSSLINHDKHKDWEKNGLGEKWKNSPRNKECNLVICMLEILCLAARVSWKVAQFRNFEVGKLCEGRKFHLVLPRCWFYFPTYQSASDCGRSVSHLVHPRCDAFFHNADYPDRSRKLIYNALRDVSHVSISFFSLIIGTFLW